MKKSLKLNLTCLKSDRCLKKMPEKIIGYLKSRDIEEIADELENSGELAIGEITVGKDLLNISKKL